MANKETPTQTKAILTEANNLTVVNNLLMGTSSLHTVIDHSLKRKEAAIIETRNKEGRKANNMVSITIRARCN